MYHPVATLGSLIHALAVLSETQDATSEGACHPSCQTCCRGVARGFSRAATAASPLPSRPLALLRASSRQRRPGVRRGPSGLLTAASPPPPPRSVPDCHAGDGIDPGAVLSRVAERRHGAHRLEPRPTLQNLDRQQLAVGKARLHLRHINRRRRGQPVRAGVKRHRELKAEDGVACPSGHQPLEGRDRVEGDGVLARPHTGLGEVLAVLVRANARLDEDDLSEAGRRLCDAHLEAARRRAQRRP
mmetsp:Transcript_51977/g.173477  ORF Transcript_51977/g.173477 Transcript_51977/m.173477 type:complete len:244 (-) Transcript_51977:32-763(-)